jgi:glycosyltransferase involved in cell wall biosynthesis
MTTRATTAPHVVHTIPSLFGPRGTIGGAERYAFELARHMADVTPTTLVSFADEAREERVGNLRVKVLGGTRRVRGQTHNPIAAGLVPELWAADVVHCHQTYILASSLAAVFARATGKRVFTTDLGGGGWDLSAYVSTSRWFHGHLHISAYSRQVAGHDGFPRARVIYGGVDAGKFHPAPRARRTGRPALFVGRLLPHKGVRYVLEAATPSVPVVLLGRPYDDGYARELRAMAAGRNVTFREGCDDDDLVAAYQEALCVVLPSVYRGEHGDETLVPELLGQTLLEGMASGIPAICSDVASMPEIVEDGATGFVVPPNDSAAIREKLSWLESHPAEAERMGAAGRARAQAVFAWPEVVRRCLEAYRA